MRSPRAVGPVDAAGAAAAPAAGGGRDRIAELQRARLLAAAAAVFDESGYASCSVGQIVERARVSRRTFYDMFASREDCLAAVLQDAVARIETELAEAQLGELSWRVGLREGLWRILCFFDREPVLARVCVVQAAGAPALWDRRARILERLAGLVEQGRGESPRAEQCSALTGEAVVGAALGVLHTRLARRDGIPLAGLLGELMELLVLPYLGASTARRERYRPLPTPPTGTEPAVVRGTADPLGGVRMRFTYRTLRVLEAVGEGEGISNRLVAERAGVHDAGQISKLLRRLEGLGLVANSGDGAHARGESNAWVLTSKGRQLEQHIRTHNPSKAA